MSLWMEHLNELAHYHDLMRAAEQSRLARQALEGRRKIRGLPTEHPSLRLMTCATILALVMMACASPVATLQPAPPVPASAAGAPAPTPQSYGAADVGGHKLMFYCTGQGSPTVILEAGGEGDDSTWGMVQSGGDRSYRVCSYDRANLGRSDSAPKPRTFQDITRDLHTLLANANIAGPYILVGHSMGGMLVRVYRDRYPDEVAGLVLVDSAHPDMGPRLLAALPPESILESKAIRTWRRFLESQWQATGTEPNKKEGVDVRAGNELVKATRPLGNLPLVVISRSPNSSGFLNMPALPADISANLSQIWQEMQNELAGLSSDSTRVIAAHAGHMIPTEEPEPVIEAIRTLVNAVRGRGGGTLPPPESADRVGQAEHTPAIMSFSQRMEHQDGRRLVHGDFRFVDAAGDAAIVINRVTATSDPLTFLMLDDTILASSNEQAQGARVTSSWGCGRASRPYWYALEYRILDRAGNMSEPVTATIDCPATTSRVAQTLILGPIAGLVLLAATAWLLIRRRSGLQK